jgi:mRNA interferase HigB
MRVTGRDKLTLFMKKHPRARGPLAAWLREVERVQWRNWADIKASFPTADLIRSRGAGHRVVFNIKGNDYRLEVLIFFNYRTVVVHRVGTHAQYNKWKFEDPS